MTNQITATIEFSFKGQILIPSAILDLDQLMVKHGTIPPLHELIAQRNDIDSYSYEYEMLVAEEIQFSNPKGMAVDFINDRHFDQLGFEQYWYEQNIFAQLNPMIKQKLAIDDIHQHPDLKAIILAAYQLGKQAN
jgi:hypothetical protein